MDVSLKLEVLLRLLNAKKILSDPEYAELADPTIRALLESSMLSAKIQGAEKELSTPPLPVKRKRGERSWPHQECPKCHGSESSWNENRNESAE